MRRCGRGEERLHILPEIGYHRIVNPSELLEFTADRPKPAPPEPLGAAALETRPAAPSHRSHPAEHVRAARPRHAKAPAHLERT